MLQHAGYARFAYNWAVGEFQAGLEPGEWLSERSLRPRWNLVKTIIAPWGKDLSQNAAKYAVIDFGQAAEAWGAYRKAVKAGKRPSRRRGFPRFKRRKTRAGLSRRQRSRYGASGRQGCHSAEDRQCGNGGAPAVQRIHPGGDR